MKKDSKNSKNLSLSSKITNVILNILIGIFVIILFFSVYISFQIKILKNDYANFFGYSFFETQTGSMKDEINPGDWIIIKLTDNVKIGDVVTYKQDNDFITHRIIEVYKDTYITKGDANKAKDKPIDKTQIIGKVTKVLPKFGIIKKTLFNTEVILALIIGIFTFNILFKKENENSKFEKVIKELIKKLFKKKKEESKEILNSRNALEKIKKEIEDKNNVNIKDSINEKEQDVIEEKIEDNTVEKEINIEENIITEIDSNINENKEETVVIQEIITNEDNPLDELLEENIEVEEELPVEDPVEELSKTTLLKIIKVDTSDLKTKIKKIAQPKVTTSKETVIKAKETKSSPIDIGKNKYDIKRAKTLVDDGIISIKKETEEKKSKNLMDKVLRIKEKELTEILNVLQLQELEYVKKSTLKDDFVKEYLEICYINITDNKTNKYVKENINEFSNSLRKKYKDKDKTLKIIDIYENTLNVMYFIEKAYENESIDQSLYNKVLTKYYKWDNDYVEFITNSIIKIQKNSRNLIEDSINKLNTKTFNIKKTKLTHSKNLNFVELEHTIEFSKSYSDYIVNKTYNEGIVAEDKLAVLLTLLSRDITTNLLSSLDIKYMVSLPVTLYMKPKKVDMILKIIDNEFAKSHIKILINIDTFINNEDVVFKLNKKGFNFVVLLNDDITVIENNINKIEIAEYFILDKSKNTSSDMLKALPKAIEDRAYLENLKKIEIYGGEK